VGDANHDGIVNGQDIAVVASHWLDGSGGGAATSAVPEPSAALLLGLGVLLLLGRYRHRALLLLA